MQRWDTGGVCFKLGSLKKQPKVQQQSAYDALQLIRRSLGRRMKECLQASWARRFDKLKGMQGCFEEKGLPGSYNDTACLASVLLQHRARPNHGLLLTVSPMWEPTLNNGAQETKLALGISDQIFFGLR